MNTAMKSMLTDLQLAKPSKQGAALRDYDSVRRAIGFISEQWRTQPTIEAMADAAHLTPDELHHLFRRWAGLTPKDFMAGAHASTTPSACCAIPPACSMPPMTPACPVRDGCMICSSPMRRCRRVNGRRGGEA